jgi:protein phosphatase
VEQLVQSGVITREEAKSIRTETSLRAASVSSPAVDVDVFEREWNAGDLLLLCSDGLHGALEDEEIVSVLSSDQTLEEMCEALVQLALNNGSTDNITLVLILREEGDLL